MGDGEGTATLVWTQSCIHNYKTVFTGLGAAPRVRERGVERGGELLAHPGGAVGSEESFNVLLS